MLKIDSVFIETTMSTAVSKFLVDVFDMEISSNADGDAELVLGNYRVKLLKRDTITAQPILFFQSRSLGEIREIMQRVEFFYFSSGFSRPAEIFRDELSDGQQITVFSPDGRAWDIFYLSV